MYQHTEFIEKINNLLRGEPAATGCCFLLYGDISDFQLVNHNYGVASGDALLAAVETLLRTVPSVQLYERFFSDQFAALVRTAQPLSDAEMVEQVTAILDKFIAAQQPAYPTCNLRICCGVCAMYGVDPVDALDIANIAHKRAKGFGATKVVLFNDAAVQTLRRRRDLEQQVNLALQQQRYTFFLQPKVSLVDGAILGAEALARRLDAHGGVLETDEGMEILEQNGSITALDLLIYRQVCEFISQRLAAGQAVVPTSVNLSRLHVYQPNVAKELHEIAQQHNIPPHLLEFELTETILLDQFEGAKCLVNELRGYGYRVSIDDFGAGYAGINLWQELDFDVLKLDRSFLSGEQPLASRNAAILPNIISIAQRLGIQVVCEGADNHDQCDYLLSIGCSYVQGYYFSRPVPPEQFYTTFAAQNGHYLLPDAQPEPPAMPLAMPLAMPRGRRLPPLLRTLVQLAVSAALLAVLTVAVLGALRIGTERLLVDTIGESLSAYGIAQTAAIRGELTNVADTMRAFSALMDANGDTLQIRSYLAAMNQTGNGTIYRFLDAAEVDAMQQDPQTAAEDVRYLEKLEAGEVVLSEPYSNGGMVLFSVGVPVLSDAGFAGVLRANLDAQMLVRAGQYTSPYGSVVAAMLLDSEGRVLYSSDTALTQDNLYTSLQHCDLSESDRAALAQLQSGELGEVSLYIGEQDGEPYYLGLTVLNLNGWHYAALFRADTVNQVISKLMRNNTAAVVGMMFVMVGLSILVLVYLYRTSRQRDLDAQRYGLLEQFSDTVLFDYDCRADTINFTPNAGMLFRVSDSTVPQFSATIAQRHALYPADVPLAQALMRGEQGEDQGAVQLRLCHPTAERYFWCMVQYRYLRDGDRLVSVVGKIVDIDEQHRREADLLEKSTHDGLTGLYNKTASVSRISRYLAEDGQGILFMFDIDDFKTINDSQGHEAGDRALRRMAAVLRTVFRASDVLGRIGGDELVVFVRHSAEKSLAEQKMTALWALLQRMDTENLLRLSVGIAIAPADGADAQALLGAADKAMYHAKNHGKNQYSFFDELPET